MLNQEIQFTKDKIVTEQDRIAENFKLDCENQHLKYYQEGYRESMLTLIHGEIKVGDLLEIDVNRYSPDGARRNSYDEGWSHAINDFRI